MGTWFLNSNIIESIKCDYLGPSWHEISGSLVMCATLGELAPRDPW